MKREISAVVFYLKSLVMKGEMLESQKVELFVQRLAAGLQEKFKGHWYPDNSSKGQAYRCIRVNWLQRQDPELLRACQESGVQYGDLRLPHELTLWVDPGEVCCRHGEENYSFLVASFSDDEEEDSQAAEEDKHVAKKALNPDAPAWYPKGWNQGTGPSGVQYGDLRLPREPTLWVDPGEVCCRHGEENYSFLVASFSDDEEEDSQAAEEDKHVAKKALNPDAPAWYPKGWNQGTGPSGVQYGDLRLPREPTLWVDPGEVCCRHGEENYSFLVASFSDDEEEDSQAAEEDKHVAKKALNPDAPAWYPKGWNQGTGPIHPQCFN